MGGLRGTKEVTASIGGTFFKVDKDEINEEVFIKRADDAVYESKNKGRNCYTVV
jgi:GGDEF domain-containing protein